MKTQEKTGPEFLTASKAARRIGCSTPTVIGLIRQGDLPAVKMTTAAKAPYCIPVDRFEEFISRKRREADSTLGCTATKTSSSVTSQAVTY